VLEPVVLEPLVELVEVLVPAPEAGAFEGVSLPQLTSPKTASVAEQIRKLLERVIEALLGESRQPMDRLPLP
jgi:hypothetical protein